MRAIYLKDLKNEIKNNLITIRGEKAHHLQKVARVKVGENILILDGRGFTVEAIIESHGKRELQVKVVESKLIESNKPNFDLAFCTPKKNACDEILKIATELGINKIYPVHSEYSSRHPFNNERVEKLLESALIQSNNPFFPKFNEVIGFNDLEDLFGSYDKVFVFSSKDDVEVPKNQIKSFKKGLVIIGPEGGFSPEEERFLEGGSKTIKIHLSTPILRAPHALSVAIGFLLGCLVE